MHPSFQILLVGIKATLGKYIHMYICMGIWASQLEIVVKNPTANEGEIRD